MRKWTTSAIVVIAILFVFELGRRQGIRNAGRLGGLSESHIRVTRDAQERPEKVYTYRLGDGGKVVLDGESIEYVWFLNHMVVSTYRAGTLVGFRTGPIEGVEPYSLEKESIDVFEAAAHPHSLLK